MDIEGLYYCSKCMRRLEEEGVCPHCGYDSFHTPVDIQHLSEGTLLRERYLLGAVIGTGGFGVTYAAWDMNLSVPVAIKEYFPVKYAYRDAEESDDILLRAEGRSLFALGLERFRREAQVLAQFKNIPGIVNVNECFDENGTAYIVMEYVHGVPLDAYVQAHKPTPRALLQMMLQPISALEIIHRQGVHHRDITPRNLLVQEDGSIKLIDFGSAREIEHTTNLIVVSDGYAPIEQYDTQRPQGPWGDIYSVSATIYHMLTGVMPPAAISRTKHDTLKKPSQLGVKLKRYQEKALMAGLAVDPEKRPRSIEELRALMYNMPLPEAVSRRRAFARRVCAWAAAAVLMMAAVTVNFVCGFPLGEGLLYSLRSDGWHVVGTTKQEEDVVVPGEKLLVPVSSIDQEAFRGHRTLKTIVLPEGVTRIGDRAFYECSSLTKITMPGRMQHIGDQAFCGCECLTGIVIPDGITSIGAGLFGNCNDLTSITIPDTVTSIGEEAFSSCARLHKIELPNSVTHIGFGAFSGCTALTSITIPDTVTSIGDFAFDGCYGLTSLTIPGSVKSIGYSAFDYCHGLTSVTILDGVTSIDDYAFGSCRSLASITLPSSVTSIGERVFNDCDALTSITIPDSVVNIGRNPFSNCDNLTSVLVSPQHPVLETMDGVLFEKASKRLVCYPCGIAAQSYQIPQGVQVIGDWAFSECRSLASITIPDSVTRIEGRAFDKCSSLESITIPDSVQHIGVYAFSNCDRLTKVTIPNGVTSIEAYAFSSCNRLESIAIPDSVTSIGARAFDSCDALTSVIIPDGVTSIGDYAFGFCGALTSAVIPKSVTHMGQRAFVDCSDALLLTVERGSYAAEYCEDNNIPYVYAPADASNDESMQRS